jgi:hypothetical protein
MVAVERLSLFLRLWDKHLRWTIVSFHPGPSFAFRRSIRANLSISSNHGWRNFFYSTDIGGCYCFNPNSFMELRMRYASVEQYLERQKESTTYRDEDLELFCVQLLGGSRWNPPYAGVISCEDTEADSMISQSNTLVEVTWYPSCSIEDLHGMVRLILYFWVASDCKSW